MPRQAKVEWVPTDTEGVSDLWINGRIAEYDVPDDERDEALRRARV